MGLYEIEDIAWECVRRNYDYQNAYRSFVSSGLNADEVMGIQGKKFTPAQEKVANEIFSRWKLYRAFDPILSSKEISEEVANHKISNSKPYYHLFSLKKMNVIEFDLGELDGQFEGSSGNCDSASIFGRQILDFITSNHDDRCLISLDCLESDSEILNRIKEIKNDVGKKIKDRKIKEDENIKKWKKLNAVDNECLIVIPKEINDSYIIHPYKLDEAFSHLDRYDSVVRDIQSKYATWRDFIVDGVIVPPKDYRISEEVIRKEMKALVRTSEVSEERLLKENKATVQRAIQRNINEQSAEETKRNLLPGFKEDYAQKTVTRYYISSYEKASSMIQLAPNRIRLQARRVEK